MAGEVQDRLAAEFADRDLYLAYEAFDLHAWDEARGSGLRERALHARARRLCVALAHVYRAAEWDRAIAGALDARRALVRERASEERAGRSVRIDNREAWGRSLRSGQLPPSFNEIIGFYLATWDGSGAVERGLGVDAAIQGRHVGRGQGSSIDGDVYSALVELKVEGPRAEDAVFTSTAEGILLLTSFSRACAALWLATRGRRFTCRAQPHRHKGKAQRKQAGTDAAIQTGARKAHASLHRMAVRDASAEVAQERDTILGVRRDRLCAAVARLPRAPAAASRFVKKTETKAASKKAHGIWTGCATEAPRLRLGGALAAMAETASARASAAQATSWLSRMSRRLPARGARQEVSASTRAPTMDAAVVDVRESLDAMFLRREEDPEFADLRKWLRIVHDGLAARCGETVERFKPAGKDFAQIDVAPVFAARHPLLVRALRALCSKPWSAWVLQELAEGTNGSLVFSRKRHVVAFLMRVRRHRF